MSLATDVPPISGITSRLFMHVARRYFRRHFRAVMAQRVEVLERASGPLIVYANHASWWDPMVCILLARMFLPTRQHYAPMDAVALERYPILKKIGIFPVETGTSRGAVQFLRTSQAILADGGILWLTPQGRFADVREFPLAFLPGLSALAERMPHVPLIPLAIEYTFWDERMPEALVRFGDPLTLSASQSQAALTATFEKALAATMLSLQQASLTRDALNFRVLLSGRRGIGGVYGFIRRVSTRLRRKPLRLDHTDRSTARGRK